MSIQENVNQRSEEPEPDGVSLALHVNGGRGELQVDTWTALLNALRERFGVRGCLHPTDFRD